MTDRELLKIAYKAMRIVDANCWMDDMGKYYLVKGEHLDPLSDAIVLCNQNGINDE